MDKIAKGSRGRSNREEGLFKMTDNVDTKELREFAKRVHLYYNNTDIMHQAADELDALRKELEYAKENLWLTCVDWQNAESQLADEQEFSKLQTDLVEKLEDQLDEARKDTKRLEFIMDWNNEVDVDKTGMVGCKATGYINGGNFRNSIDEIMKRYAAIEAVKLTENKEDGK